MASLPMGERVLGVRGVVATDEPAAVADHGSQVIHMVACAAMRPVQHCGGVTSLVLVCRETQTLQRKVDVA